MIAARIVPVLTLAAMATACASPQLTAVGSPNVSENQSGRLRLHGVGLRAGLEVGVGGANRRPLFIARPTLGEVAVDPLPAGRYDVVLYDDGREISRLADALLVSAPAKREDDSPSRAVQLVGALQRIDRAMSERLSRAVGKPGPHGVTILKLGPVRPSRYAPRQVERAAVIWVPLDRSCWTLPSDRLLKRPTPLVVDLSGSEIPWCATELGKNRADEIALERDVILTLATAAGRVTMPVEAIRRADAVPAFLARHAARVRATVMNADAETRLAFTVRGQLYMTPTVVLGVIDRTDERCSGGLGLALNVACTPDDVSCTAAPSPYYPPVRLMPGTIVPVLAGDRTVKLRIDAVHAIDEPMIDECVARAQ